MIGRFADKVDVAGLNECWTWNGVRNNKGYGTFRMKPLSVERMSHRIMWFLENGEIPKGKCVLHTCDNPPCVNPNHLFIGSYKENAADMKRKGRSLKGRPRPYMDGENHPRALFNSDDITAICKMRSEGSTLIEIANTFGCGTSCIHRITSGQTLYKAKKK